MELEFLSVGGWRPESAEEDTVSLFINRSIMIDTGWHPIHNLLRLGARISDVKALFFTHMHQDHCMGLPALLFYLLNSAHDAGTLHIYGPKGVCGIVDKALDYAGKNRDYPDCTPPEVTELSPGDTVELNGVHIATTASHHAVIGLCYRFTDIKSGRSVTYTGDTRPMDDIARFAIGSDVLIHEQSWGAQRPMENPNLCCHSSAEDAARCAKAADVGRLCLVHSPDFTCEESVRKASAIFSNVSRPVHGERIAL